MANTQRTDLSGKDIADSQKTPDIGDRQKTSEIGDSQKTPDTGDSQKTPDIVDSQKTPDIGYSQKTREIGDGQKTRDIGYGQKTPDIGYGQKTPDTRKARELSDTSSTREVHNISRTRELPDTSYTREVRNTSNTREQLNTSNTCGARNPLERTTRSGQVRSGQVRSGRPDNSSTERPRDNSSTERPRDNSNTERPRDNSNTESRPDSSNTERQFYGSDAQTSRNNDKTREGPVSNQATKNPIGDQEASSLTSPTPTDRALRFVTIRQARVETMRPFYDGDYVSERMGSIRRAIDYIRRHWDQYDHFIELLQRLLKDKMDDFKVNDPELLGHTKALFSGRKEWREHGSDVGDDRFDAIRVYTSPQGYFSFFSVINSLFRKDDSTQSDKVIRAAVFLVELLNIDLYNYCLKYPHLGNFQGRVYRGVCLSDEDFHKFHALLGRPIDKRYISIPLGLVSSSLDRLQAEHFLSMQSFLASRLLLMEIHVIGLNLEHLAFYRQKFPGSVVSTICAVDIHQLSYVKDEKEVLLRGPFFQVLQLHEGRVVSGRRTHVLEAVMLNTNRDHLTSVQLQGEQETVARRLFATMVTVTRCQFCVQYCRQNELPDDAAEYQRLLEEKRQELAAMTGHQD